METPIHLQEIIFSSSDAKRSRQLSLLEEEGRIKKIAPRLFTGKLDQPAETLIRRNIFTILGTQYEGAILSHRSALEYKPTDGGHLYITYTYTKKISLPGITLHFLQGQGPLPADNRLMGELFVSQEARAYLENLQISRRSGEESKTLPLEIIEAKLDRIIQSRGEEGINQLRDTARRIAPELGMEAEFDKLNKIISALLATHPAKGLASASARARATGLPYDGERIRLFETLFAELQQREFPRRADKNTTDASFGNFAFYESYFSNYIEGTVFSIEEAKAIIETQTPLPARNEDSHDVLGTFQLVSNRQEMRTVPISPAHLLDILRYRHQILLAARSSKQPGAFRSEPVYAGQTTFVDAELISGTLIRAYDYYQALRTAFSKAIYMMFIVSEVHPFLDGNGRIARVMMNAELVSTGESKIIIPTVYRDDYIGALRRFTRQGDCDPYIRMMDRAHTFSENVYGNNRDEMENYLRTCNAFYEDNEGRILQVIPRS
ncbi:MAG: Fic family protein [Bacteroidota bacterium]